MISSFWRVRVIFFTSSVESREEVLERGLGAAGVVLVFLAHIDERFVHEAEVFLTGHAEVTSRLRVDLLNFRWRQVCFQGDLPFPQRLRMDLNFSLSLCLASTDSLSLSFLGFSFVQYILNASNIVRNDLELGSEHF
jgi:hypothetical protein